MHRRITQGIFYLSLVYPEDKNIVRRKAIENLERLR